MKAGHLLWLCVVASFVVTAQRVVVTVTPKHTFEYKPITGEKVNPVKPSRRLKRKAAAWCEDRKNELSVPVSDCADSLAATTSTELLKARGEVVTPPAGQHTLSPEFFEIVTSIFHPGFGTEQLAPFLHSLLRMHRPESVVELGYGYTTPFLAQALADNAANVASERREDNTQRRAGVLRHAWYDENPEYSPMLYVVDNGSQRGDDDSMLANFARAVNHALEKLRLSEFVTMHAEMELSEAHTLFEEDSIDLVWNDAQWDPNFLRQWWPLVKKDGGLLLLHNVIGNGELSRWCLASPRRVMKELFPDEKFEFLTLQEPHKGHQGSVAMLRRLDPEKKPKRYMFLWGGKDEEEDELERFSNWFEAVQRSPPTERDL